MLNISDLLNSPLTSTTMHLLQWKQKYLKGKRMYNLPTLEIETNTRLIESIIKAQKALASKQQGEAGYRYLVDALKVEKYSSQNIIESLRGTSDTLQIDIEGLQEIWGKIFAASRVQHTTANARRTPAAKYIDITIHTHGTRSDIKDGS